jgi:phage terminase small subunit
VGDRVSRKKLTLKQQKFIEVYLQTSNATEAARKAGYKGSDEVLASIGWENLRKLEIKRQIEKRVEESEVASNEVIGTLASQMRADVTTLFNESNGFDIQTIKEKGLGHLIKKIKVRREWESGKDEEKIPVDVIELELHSQQAAAVQLCKVLGIEQEPAKNKGELTKRMLKKLVKSGLTPKQAADDLIRLAVDKADVDAALKAIEAHEPQTA